MQSIWISNDEQWRGKARVCRLSHDWLSRAITLTKVIVVWRNRMRNWLGAALRFILTSHAAALFSDEMSSSATWFCCWYALPGQHMPDLMNHCETASGIVHWPLPSLRPSLISSGQFSCDIIIPSVNLESYQLVSLTFAHCLTLVEWWSNSTAFSWSLALSDRRESRQSEESHAFSRLIEARSYQLRVRCSLSFHESFPSSICPLADSITLRFHYPFPV